MLCDGEVPIHDVIDNVIVSRHVLISSGEMAAGDDRVREQRRALLGEDDASLVFETSKEVKVISTFDQMGLRDDLLRGIYAYGNEL